MSYMTVSSTRRYGDEWLQVKCDDCETVGPRIEVIVPKRGPLPEHLFKLAKQVAGFVEQLRPWRNKSGRRGKGMAVHDLCPACAFKARVTKLIADLGGPFGPPEHESTDP